MSKINYFCLLAAILSVIACDDKEAGGKPDLNGKVYAVGRACRTSAPLSVEGCRAVLWVDGRSVVLDRSYSVATSVWIDGGDVYVGGSFVDGDSGPRACIWVNGSRQALGHSDSNSDVYGVCVAGGRVYAAGSAGERAVLWIDGQAAFVDAGPDRSYGNSVFVSGHDVYMAGMAIAGGNPCPTLWKNGEIFYQKCDGGDDYKSLYVSAGRVYVAGSHIDGTAVCQSMNTDGSEQRNELAGDLNTARALFVSGGRMFVAGDSYNAASMRTCAMLVAGGQGQVLEMSCGSANSRADALFVDGSDVYVGGGEADYAMIWKNGQPEVLSTGMDDMPRGRVSGIFVVE